MSPKLLLTALGVSASVGCTEPGQSNGPREFDRQTSQRVQEIYSTVKRPTTPIEILKNIKTVCDNDLAFRQDFYLPDRLMEFAGSEKVNIVTGSELEKWAFASRFEDIMSPIVKYPLSATFIYWSAAFSQEPPKHNAWIEARFAFSDASLSFDNVVRLWGNNWRVIQPQVYQRRFANVYPNSQHASMAIEYNEERPPYKVSVTMEFNFQGNLGLMACLEEIR